GPEPAPPGARRARARAPARERDQDARGAHPRPAGRAGRAAGGGRGMTTNGFPSTWKEHKLGDLGRYINGRAFKPAEWGSKGLPIIRIQNLTDPDKPYNYFDGHVSEKHLVRDGDLLISWSATLGSFIWDRGDAALNQHIFKVKVNERLVEKEFLHYLILHILDELASQTHGSTMKHITKRKFD